MAHWRDDDRDREGGRRDTSRVEDIARGVYTARDSENDYASRSWYAEPATHSTIPPRSDRTQSFSDRGVRSIARDEYAGMPGYGSAHGELGDDYFRTTTGSDVGRYERDAASHRGRGPRSFSRTDERLHELVCELLTEDHDVDASEVEVSVRDGVVLLDGAVPERRMAYIAEEIAASVNGVREVDNRLRAARQREVPATWEW